MNGPGLGRGHAKRRPGVHPAAWPVVELMATVAAQLVLTPLLLHRLGAGQFAVWVIAQSLLLASSTLSLGMGTALMTTLAGAWAQQDAQGGWAAIRHFLLRTAKTSLLALAVGLVAIAAFRNPAWMPELTRGEVTVLGATAILWVCATELDNGMSAAVKALHGFRDAACIEVVGRIGQVALTWLLVAAGSTAWLPVLIALAMTGLRVGLKYALLRRRWPEPPVSARVAAASAHLLPRELNSTGAWVWLGMLSGLAFYAFDRWFVGAWFGSTVLAAYAVCSQLAQLPHAVVSAAGQTLVPWAAKRRDRLGEPAQRHQARRLMLSTTAVAVLPSLLLLVLLEPLLSLWISASFATEHLALARWLTLISLVLSLNVPSYFLLFGFSQVRVPTALSVVSGGVFIAGCLLMSPSLEGFIVLRGLFAVLLLSLVLYFLASSGRQR